MTSKTFRSAKQAREFLTGLGMTSNYTNDEGREYFWYNDGTDALLDHTATITRLGTAKYAVSVFDRKPVDTMNPDNGDDGLAIDAAIDNGTELPSVAAEKVKPAKPTRVNRHWNDDGSLTLYVNGLKFRRLGGEDNEEASEDEIDDTEGYAERLLSRKFPKKAGGWVWGRTTQGHNWHTKRLKALRARIAAGEAAGEDVSAIVAELAKLGGK